MGYDAIESSNAGDMEPSYRTRYRLLESLTKLVGSGKANGLIVLGDPGVSKSTTVMRALAELGLVEGEGFVVYKGHTSPLGIYLTLWQETQAGTSGRAVVVFDDCDAALGREGINLVKACLDSKEKREVSFISSKLPSGVKSQFIFTGRIIFITNLPLAKLDTAVADRCMTFEISLSRDELFMFIEREVLPQDHLGTNLAQRRYVLRRMQAALSKSPVKASVRLYKKLLDLWCHDRPNFNDHIAALLPKSDELAMLRHFLDRYDTVGAAANAYAEKFKKSTRSFYLLKARYRDLL